MRAQELLPLIALAINKGSVMFNRGDASACASLYEQTSKQMLASGVDGFPKSALQEALNGSISARSDNEKAWILRHAFDSIISYAQSENTIDTTSTPTPIDAVAMRLMDPSSAVWSSMHDRVMGGVSSGGMHVNIPSDGATFRGTVRTENNGGFASIRSAVKWDTSGFTGLYVDAISEDPSRIFSLNLKDERCQQAGVNFKSRFKAGTSRTRIFLPFSSFSSEFRGRAVDVGPLSVGQIVEVSVMAMKPAGDFAITLLEMGAYSSSTP